LAQAVNEHASAAVMQRVLAWALVAHAFDAAPVGVHSAEHHCTPHVDKTSCLSDKGCMFLELEGENRCLPCELEDSPNPCPPVDSVYAMKKVKRCTMQCGHQAVISKVSACEDTSGDITMAQCFAKGTSAVTKCMWTQYSQGGKIGTACGPCSVGGIGTVPCVTAGMPGPAPGSLSILCASQCDEAMSCDPMLPGCSNPTSPPPPPAPMAWTPEDFKIKMDKDAPDYIVTKVMPPYDVKSFENAARLGAQAALWGPDTKQAPTAPLAIFGSPPVEGPPLPPELPVLYGPAPPGMPGVPPPGYGFGTAPPPAMVEASKSQFLQVESQDTNVEFDSSEKRRKVLRLRKQL